MAEQEKRTITKRQYTAMVKELDELYWDCGGRDGYRSCFVCERALKILQILNLDYTG